MSTAMAAPVALSVQRDTIPATLRQRGRWLCWRYEPRQGKWTKVPYRADGHGRASATDPATWCPLTAALDAYDNGHYDGIGFALGDGIVGIDHDAAYDPVTHVLSDGAAAWARLGAYRELSPSGTGVHDLVVGRLPDDPRRTGWGRRNGPLEVYAGDRYLTVTGRLLPGAPNDLPIDLTQLRSLYEAAFPAPSKERPSASRLAPIDRSDDATVLSRARAARNADRFESLWQGDTSAHSDDESAADLALLSHLAFWTQDPMQLDRLYRSSGLMREKWERPDYRERTIARALERSAFYEPGQPASIRAGQHTSASMSGAVGRLPADQAVPFPVLPPEARHGLIGDILAAIEPETEADPAALLMTLLVLFGAAVGRGPHLSVSADRHGVNLFAVVVGDTAKARKGTSRAYPELLLTRADLTFRSRIAAGVGSGEGIVWAIRDPIVKVTKGVESIEDQGVEDKRLCVFEEEFSSVVKVMLRDGNTVSETLRRAWDSRSLGNLTKNSPARCADPHVALLGHVTKTELLRVLTETEAANGFANRILWTCAQRSRLLPEGGSVDPATLGELAEALRGRLGEARQRSEVQRTPQARSWWAEVYEQLSAPGQGMMGAMTARSEAHVLRLSLVYALLNGATAIDVDHLEAAVALWTYCEESVRYLFGESLGNPVADQIRTALQSGPLSRTQISDLFARNQPAHRIASALGELVAAGLASPAMTPNPSGAGRSIEMWSLGQAVAQ